MADRYKGSGKMQTADKRTNVPVICRLKTCALQLRTSV